MKLPRTKAEFVALLNTTEKVLQDLVERKAIRIIPGISATLPTPTKPIPREPQPTSSSQDSH